MNKQGKTITKMALYLRAMRVSLWIVLPFFVLISLMAFTGAASIQPGLQSALWFISTTTLSFFAILLLILTPLALQDLHHIRKQEKHFGFNFNNEMKQLDIRSFSHMDAKWLIHVNRFRIYAFRKGFLVDFGFQRKSMLGKKMETKVMASCADGKIRTLAGDAATLSAIQDWAQSKTKIKKK